MSSKFIPGLLLIFGSVVLRAPAGTLSIDGVSQGPVVKWSGGDIGANVVTGASAGKQLGQPRFDPVVVEVPLPLAATLVAWINEFAAGRHLAKNLVLTETDASGRAAPMLTTLQAGGAYLTAVRFPPGDALSRTGATVVLEFGVDQAQLAISPAPSGTNSVPARTTATVQHFRLTIDNLGPTGVAKVGAVEITRAPEGGTAGEAIVTAMPTGPTRLSNLTVTLADSAAAAWRTWFTDFVINGNNDNVREKAGSLEFLASDLSTVELRLQLTQVGIARLTRQPGTTDSAPIVQVELYVEQVAIAAAATPTTQTSQTQPASAPTPAAAAPAPAAAAPAPDTSATATPPAPVAPARVASTVPVLDSTRTSISAGNPGFFQIRPVNTVVPPAATNTVAKPFPASPATPGGAVKGTAPADEGSRDPIDFPRVGGLTRLTFSGSSQKNYVRESATYAAVDDLRRVVDSVTSTAQAAGWEQISLFETGNRTVGRTVNVEWVKGTIRAQMNLVDGKPVGTTLTLWVTGEKSGGG
jgi:hypothetical protein